VPTEVSSDGRVVAADPRKYGDYFKKMVATKKGPMQQTLEARNRQLELQRKKLDDIKVG